MHFTIRIMKACPEMCLQAGDLVTFEPEPGSPECPVFLHRPLPASSLDSLVLLLESGGAKPLTPHWTVADSFLRMIEAASEAAKASPSPKPAVQPVPAGPLDINAALEALQRPDPQAPHERGRWPGPRRP
jgi:hypothetical protein